MNDNSEHNSCNRKSAIRPEKQTRRRFLKRSATVAAGVSLLGGLSLDRAAHAQGSGRFKIALIGCGGRGTGAAIQALSTKADVQLVAMADAFRGSLDRSFKAIKNAHPARVNVPEERKFAGLDAYQKAIDAGVDVVLLCTPPGFRPMQYEAAVKAGKHVFMEKPLAVDAPGTRRILAANEEAKKKNLMVAVGFHMRHEPNRQEIVKHLQDGAIGKVEFFRAYFNSNGVWVRPRKPDQTEMQYQVNNWYYFNWLSDGHQAEHDDLFAALTAGTHYNECDSAADSTMTAILGRMATYSGKAVFWEDAINSQLDLSPAGYSWDALPQSKPGPDGIYPAAIPGITKAF